MGDSPVWEAQWHVLSRAGHVKSCLKIGGPPPKAKYSLLTDSEPVPWGKGEKHPDEGSEIDLKPNAYNQSEPQQVVTAYLLYNGSASYFDEQA